MGRARRKGTTQNNEDDDEEETENTWVPGTKVRPIGNVRTKGEITMDVSKDLSNFSNLCSKGLCKLKMSYLRGPQGAKLLGFRLSGTSKNTFGNPTF